MITYLTGDATRPQTDGLKYIVHICNNRNGWGRGFVLALSKRWTEPEVQYRLYSDDLELGTIQMVPVEPDIVVVNMIAQDGYRSAQRPCVVDYNALANCLQYVKNYAQQEPQTPSIHMPRIGCGLAGAKWEVIRPIIEWELVNLPVYVYDL